MKVVDLNCDVGEIPEMIADGRQAGLLAQITSANIACGGHAGNAEMMRATIEQAQAAGVAIGAHPGYEDPTNFGRIELQLSDEEIASSVHRQILALEEIAISCGARIVHVKPHGALYNQAARDTSIACAIAEGVARWNKSKNVILMGLAGSVTPGEFRKAGFRVAAEAFADRAMKTTAACVPESLTMPCYEQRKRPPPRPCASFRKAACFHSVAIPCHLRRRPFAFTETRLAPWK